MKKGNLKIMIFEIIWYLILLAAGFFTALAVFGGTPRENTVALSHRHYRVFPSTNNCLSFPPIQYPADMTNFTWMLQRSHDLTNWENLQYFGAKGLPVSSYTVDVTNPPVFFRMLEMP